MTTLSAAPLPRKGPATDGALAVCLLAVDPAGVGGMVLRAGHGAAVEHLLAMLRGLLPAGAPLRRMPLQIGDARLLGGLDLAATLTAGRPVLERGLLAEADGGAVVLPMAERLSPAAAARLASVLDSGEVVVERDGFALRHASRFAVVALDEGIAAEERPPPALLDRLAIHLDLRDAGCRDLPDSTVTASAIEATRARLHRVRHDDSVLRSFCGASMLMGVASLRAPILAMRVARAHAALAGRDRIADEDAAVAARLVLAPRATALPPGPQDETAHPDPPPGADDESADTDAAGELEDTVLDAARAAIPPDLLAALQAPAAVRTPSAGSGRVGGPRPDARRGRPVGTRRGDPGNGARLDVVETLRAASPWQRLRRNAQSEDPARRVLIRRDDFRIARFKHRSETATLFVVDASGSAALHRLREAKGAVELLLADCYVRRDQVALIAFRGRSAELILPPTRSLTRAKRTLAALPGGGGTPMAAAIDAASVLADGLRRRGLSPAVVMLTDGRANVARDGSGGRERAESEALAAARACRAMRLAAVVVDTSPAPGPAAERLAEAMGARYLPLPRADAASISSAVRAWAPVQAR